MPIELVADRVELLRALDRCRRVAGKSAVAPMLRNVLLRATAPDKLTLAATDLCCSATSEIVARVDRGGAVVVDAHDLFDRVKLLREGAVAISADDAVTTIRAVGTARRYKMFSAPSDDFPSLAEPAADTVFATLEVDVLAKLIAGTRYAISSDMTRLHMNGALLELKCNSARMVATDGHRLAMAELASSVCDKQMSILIPLRGVLELKRLCDETGDAEIEIAQSGPDLLFLLNNFCYSVRMVEAQFPPYEQVIPKAADKAVRVMRLALADALRAVALAASDRMGGVKLTVENGKIRLESASPESGEGFDEIAIDYDGAPTTICLSARYLLGALGAIEEDEVVLGFNAEMDPVVLEPTAESGGKRYLAVVMPMRI